MSRFPIIRAALLAPRFAVLQPYWLAEAAVSLLELAPPDSRRFRVAKTLFESELQRLYTDRPLAESKPKRALTPQEIAAVRTQAERAKEEWDTVTGYFAADDKGEAGERISAHSIAELRQMLSILDPPPVAGHRGRRSALTGVPARVF